VKSCWPPRAGLFALERALERPGRPWRDHCGDVRRTLSAVEPPVAPKLILSAPPSGKKVTEMTADELRAWADAIFDAMAGQRPVVEAAGDYLRRKAQRGPGAGYEGDGGQRDAYSVT